MTQSFIFLVPVGLSLILGILLVQYLTVHPLKMSLYLIGTCLAFFLLIVVLWAAFRGSLLWISIALSLLFFALGYIAMTLVFLNREDSRPVPEITRQKDDPGLGHTAVVYFTHGEPETYDPSGWINQFNEFKEQGIPFMPLIAIPFFIYQLRNKYLEVGRSNHRQMHARMIQSLETMYRVEGDTNTKFYLSFLDDNPRPDAAVIQALNDGASRIIVSEVFLTISNHTAEGEELIKELNIEQEYDVPVLYTGPLHDSSTLKNMFIARADANIGETDKSEVGVLLIGHGQPDEWDAEWPTETEQETGFREDVLHLLADNGYAEENIGLAWMEFKQPEPAIKVTALLNKGVEKILFFAASISADAIHSQHDIPALVQKADIPEGFPVINLGAWNDDPIVIQAIKEEIDQQMDHYR